MIACGTTPRAGLLFDLDGTLAQTEHLHHAAFNGLLALYGRSLDHPTFLRHVSGRSNDDITGSDFDNGTPDLYVTSDGNVLEFRILDSAPPVDPCCVRPKPLGEVRAGGLGVALIDSVMDEWNICSRPDGCGNKLIMRKRVEARRNLGEDNE